MSKYDHYYLLAEQALTHYDIDVKNISFLIEETNIFYKIDTDCESYVLKIFQEESSQIEDNLIEAILLEEVSKNTNIIVPRIIRSKDQKQIIFLKSDHFDIQKRVAVYSFIEGVDFDKRETNELFFELGKVMAKLHHATKKIVLPDGLVPKKWDKVFYYRNEEILYNNPKYVAFFEEKDLVLYERFLLFLEEQLPKYYQDQSFLLHADLNPWNIKLFENEIRLLDFEEGLEGTVVHEMAICLFYYRYDKNYNYQEVKEHLFSGYQSITQISKISDYDLDLLMMARTANFINYVLILYDDPREYIKERMRRIKEFIDNYDITI